MNAAKTLLAGWVDGATSRDYRAAHALRGTPPRKHWGDPPPVIHLPDLTAEGAA